MFVRVVTAMLGVLGILYILSRLTGEGASVSAELPGAVIGLLICLPFILYGLLGAERFARLLPRLAFLVEDPQQVEDGDGRKED